MVFSSILFLFVYLPVVLAVYYIVPARYRNLWLFIVNLVFYGWGEPVYILLMVFSIALNYAAGLLIARYRLTDDKKARAVLTVNTVVNLALLIFFKYFDLLAATLSRIPGISIPALGLTLPIGISFYTFQTMSYPIDVYRGDTEEQKNFIRFGTFVALFPQLIAGPIVLHSEIVPQFADAQNRHFNFDNFAPGLYAFARGLMKKVVIADTFAVAVEAGFASAQTLNTAEAWFVAIGYTLQLYFDFSGYCDMATGVGLMFNIKIPINFNSPYKSLNIREFWQRWHITLSRFLTTYIYFPLGGSRKGMARTCVNLMIVFLLSGLWHGAGWLFLLWGLMHGAASVLYRLFRKPYDRLHPALQWLINFGFIVVAWVFFRATSLTDALAIVKSMLMMNFGPLRDSITSAFALPGGFHEGYNAIYMMIWYAASLFACLGLRNTYEKTMDFHPTLCNALTTVLMIVYCTLSLSSVSVFLYFNF